MGRHFGGAVPAESNKVNYAYLQSLSDEEYAQYWQKWHEKREQLLNSNYGWLSLRSIDWLTDGKTITIPNFPGTWTQRGDTVIYTPEEGKKVFNRGKLIVEPKEITVDVVADVNVEDFDYEGVRAQLIKRLGASRKFAVRQRDPNSISRKKFQGVPHFKPDKKWVVPARYTPFDKWENVGTAAVVGELSHNETAIGRLYFTIDGKERSLVVFQGHNDDSGWTKTDPETRRTVYLDNRQNVEGVGFVLFRDATSGKQTYGGARDLAIDISDPKALDYVDFNKAANLPCAFTYYCTCPFAPEENRLDIAIEAGETTPNVVDAD